MAVFGFSPVALGIPYNTPMNFQQRHRPGIWYFETWGSGGGGGSINAEYGPNPRAAEAGSPGLRGLYSLFFPHQLSFSFQVGSGGLGAPATEGFEDGLNGSNGGATFITGLFTTLGGVGGRGRLAAPSAPNYNPINYPNVGAGGQGGNLNTITSWTSPSGQRGTPGSFTMTRRA